MVKCILTLVTGGLVNEKFSVQSMMYNCAMLLASWQPIYAIYYQAESVRGCVKISIAIFYYGPHAARFQCCVILERALIWLYYPVVPASNVSITLSFPELLSLASLLTSSLGISPHFLPGIIPTQVYFSYFIVDVHHSLSDSLITSPTSQLLVMTITWPEPATIS